VNPTAKGVSATKVGINNTESTNDSVSVYPTQATDIITIDYANTLQTVLKIQLINSDGQVVFSTTKYDTASESIDVTNYSSGIYFVRLQGDKGNVVKKIMIK
jgi:hypothetical protein